MPAALPAAATGRPGCRPTATLTRTERRLRLPGKIVTTGGTAETETGGERGGTGAGTREEDKGDGMAASTTGLPPKPHSRSGPGDAENEREKREGGNERRRERERERTGSSCKAFSFCLLSLSLSLLHTPSSSRVRFSRWRDREFKALLTFLLRDPFCFLDAMADILAACVKQTCISDPRQLEEEQTQEEEEEGGTRRDAAEVTQEMTPEVTREVTPEAGPPSALLPGKETVSRIYLVS